MKNKSRCIWATGDPLNMVYHDHEWGVPNYDNRVLFEFLILEGAQAGLNWLTVLKKRENYRECFDQFDPEKIASYGKRKINSLLKNPGIIRNELKVNAAVKNAQAYLDLHEEWDDFSSYIWHFVDDKPIQNKWKQPQEVPDKTNISELMSKDLKKRGFKFVGSTICYAYMQAVGMVNDHTVDCFRHREVG